MPTNKSAGDMLWVAFAGAIALSASCTSGDTTCITGPGGEDSCTLAEGAPLAEPFDVTAPTRSLSVLETDLEIGSSGPDVELVQEYLAAYGYFQNTALDRQYPRWQPVVPQLPERGVFDELTSQAVREYQLRARLDLTGNVDAATRDAMRSGRCGIPEGIRARDPSEKFALYGGWTRGVTVTWKVLGGTSPALRPAGPAGTTVLRSQATKAFATWAAATSINFVEETSASSGNIQIYFANLGATTTLGDGEPPDGRGADGIADLRVNSNGFLWSYDGTPAANEQDLESLLLHEIGHTIGLQHSSISNAVMHSGLAPNTLVTSLALDDKVAVSAQYDTWTPPLNGGSVGIDVGGSGGPGLAWVLGASTGSGGYLIYQHDGAGNFLPTLTKAGANDGFRAYRIAVDAAGVPWVVQQNGGSIYRRKTNTAAGGGCPSTGSCWEQVVPGSCATDIDVGWDGSVWIVGCSADNLGIRKLDRSATSSLSGASWSAAIGSSVARLAVDGNGIPWVAHNNFSVERRTTNNPSTGSWQSVNAAASDLAAGPVAVDDSGVKVSYVYMLGQSDTPGGHFIYVWDEQSAGPGGPPAPVRAEARLLDGAAATISVGPDGNPWVTDSFNGIYRRVR